MKKKVMMIFGTRPEAIIKAMGQSTFYLVIDIIKKIVGIIVLIVTVFCFNEVLIIILGALILEVFSVLILFPINKKNMNYGYGEQILDIVPNVAISIIMCGVIYLMDLFLPPQGMVCLILEIFVGVMAYMFESIVTHNESYIY